jgi:hypothetical protein
MKMQMAQMEITRAGIPAHTRPTTPRWPTIAAACLGVFRCSMIAKSPLWKSSLCKSLLCRVAAKRKRKLLSVCETAALGDRRFVSVVQFERQRFLIGSSPSSVSLLSHLPDESPSSEQAGERN